MSPSSIEGGRQWYLSAMSNLVQAWAKTTIANKLNVLATGLATVAATASVAVTLIQWRTSVEQRKARDRPWVSLVSGDVHWSRRNQYEMTVRLRNFGNAAAHDTVFDLTESQPCLTEQSNWKPGNSVNRKAVPWPASMGLIVPQQEVVMFRGLQGVVEDDEIAAIGKTCDGMTFFGTISYRDDDKGEHKSPVCFQITPGKDRTFPGEPCAFPHGGLFGD